MLRVSVIQINVSDMDVAIDFYCNTLGFAVRSREAYPNVVVLEDPGMTFLLYRVEKPTKIDYPNVAQTLVNFETTNLVASLDKLRRKGVDFIHSTPQACPVGVYAAFRDPFGNVHELLEFQRK